MALTGIGDGEGGGGGVDVDVGVAFDVRVARVIGDIATRSPAAAMAPSIRLAGASRGENRLARVTARTWISLIRSTEG